MIIFFYKLSFKEKCIWITWFKFCLKIYTKKLEFSKRVWPWLASSIDGIITFSINEPSIYPLPSIIEDKVSCLLIVYFADTLRCYGYMLQIN